MNKILNYITYQSFPADTANSLQTISNIKYFVRNGYEVNLYFPLRDKNSSSNLSDLQSHYSFKENVNIFGIRHPYPFGKIKRFNKLFFHLSHFLWSRKFCKQTLFTNSGNEMFFTRSDWILYFLSKKNINIVFECHQYSKIRNYVLKKLSNKNNVKIIFLNKFIKNAFKFELNNFLLLPSAVDLDRFETKIETNKKPNDIVFIGTLLRFGNNRGFEFLFDSFKNLTFLNNFNLKIIGGPNSEAEKLKSFVHESKQLNIEIMGRLNREEVIEQISISSIGLLINPPDKHSKYFTSPLKYFEYIAGGLKVVAVDYPAHRDLPFQENIYYFRENDEDSLLSAIKNATEKEFIRIKRDSISLDQRIKKIIDFYNK